MLGLVNRNPPTHRGQLAHTVASSKGKGEALSPSYAQWKRAAWPPGTLWERQEGENKGDPFVPTPCKQLPGIFLILKTELSPEGGTRGVQSPGNWTTTEFWANHRNIATCVILHDLA